MGLRQRDTIKEDPVVACRVPAGSFVSVSLVSSGVERLRSHETSPDGARPQHPSTPIRSAFLLALGLILAACTSPDVVYDYPDETAERYEKTKGSLLGTEGFILGAPTKKVRGDEGGGLGVNSYLWRATLDTITFMPVNSADPFGGVIITDWHAAAAAPTERFKLNIYILGQALRADGVRVAVFRQVRDGAGWRDAPVPAKTGTQIEDAILTRARQLRNSSLQ